MASVGTVTWQEQPGSPRVTRSPEGALTITVTLRGETTDQTALDTKLNSYTIGEPNAAPWDDTYLEQPQGTMQRKEGFSIITLTYRGGLTQFVEFQDSPQQSTRPDGTDVVVRRYHGPGSGLKGFLDSKMRGSSDPNTGYEALILKSKQGNGDGANLAIASLTYEGTLFQNDPNNPEERTTSVSYMLDAITFYPWGDNGPAVTGFYRKETVTVQYVSNTRPSTPQFDSELSSGDNTFFFAFTPSSFDPDCAPHNLTKQKVNTAFTATNRAGAGFWNVSETWEWRITDGTSNFNP